MVKLPFLIICIFFLASSCSLMVLDSDAVQTQIGGVLVYLPSDKEDIYQSSLDIYRTDLENEGLEVSIDSWAGDAASLREELQDWADGSWCALFIGDMPYVNFALGGETFPTDLYFSSPATGWSDDDGNGVYDRHGALQMTVPVSRIIGSDDEIIAYFDKVHRYRAGTLYFDDSGTIFKDDDWSDYRRGSSFGADRIVSDVTVMEALDISTRDQYGAGINRAEKYLYQWIHANPSALYVQEGSEYLRFNYYDIDMDTVDVGFLNLFDCQAARYTQTNLAMSYLMKTDSALAVTGSTKKGGNFDPLEFHRLLAAGRSWAEAFRGWYNAVGVYDDMWYLGMVIMGDPALVPGEAEKKSGGTDLSRLLPPSQEEKDYFFTLMSDFTDSR